MIFKASNIASVEEIQSHLGEIQPFTEAEYNADNIDAVINRAQQLEAYMALTSKLLADAKYRHNEFLNSKFLTAIKDAIKVNMPVSLTNKYVDSLCIDYRHLVDWADRLNATCTHQLDFSRSLISKLKNEMNNISYGNFK